MYIALLALTMFVLPALSIGLALAGGSQAGWAALLGQWFVFWAVGVRLMLAGLRQWLQPEFTAREIFRFSGTEAHQVIQELGFANIALATLGLIAVAAPGFVLPAAVAGGLFYAAAGLRHIQTPDKTRNETIAMTTDLWAAAVLAVVVLTRL
jgi:hypothetical protein